MAFNHKIKGWVSRYLPAELCSIAATVAAAYIIFKWSGSRIGTAFAATWAGNLAYFGYIISKDVIKRVRFVKKEGRHYTKKDFWYNLRALFVEFGLAELLDSLVIRPALSYYIPLWVGSLLYGTLIAKFAADVTFYIPAIIGHEISKKL